MALVAHDHLRSFHHPEINTCGNFHSVLKPDTHVHHPFGKYAHCTETSEVRCSEHSRRPIYLRPSTDPNTVNSPHSVRTDNTKDEVVYGGGEVPHRIRMGIGGFRSHYRERRRTYFPGTTSNPLSHRFLCPVILITTEDTTSETGNNPMVPHRVRNPDVFGPDVEKDRGTRIRSVNRRDSAKKETYFRKSPDRTTVTKIFNFTIHL